ncbi:unnamed protein product [Caenorhabditis brenneri]
MKTSLLLLALLLVLAQPALVWSRLVTGQQHLQQQQQGLRGMVDGGHQLFSGRRLPRQVPHDEEYGLPDRATQQQIEEYNSIMDALRILEEEGIMRISEDGNLEVNGRRGTDDHFANRLCGNRMVEKIASLCVGQCTTGKDVAGRLCTLGMTDQQIVHDCCPTSARDPLPQHWAF